MEKLEQCIENEVKLSLSDPETVREYLRSQDAIYEGTWTESDTYFARAHGVRGENIRVRRIDGETGSYGMVAYKGPLHQSRFLRREEIESRVDDPGAFVAMYGRFGFEVVDRIEKRREQYRLGPLMVAIDFLDSLGYFLEVEGSDDQIKEAVAAMGLRVEDHIHCSYSALRDHENSNIT